MRIVLIGSLKNSLKKKQKIDSKFLAANEEILPILILFFKTKIRIIPFFVGKVHTLNNRFCISSFPRPLIYQSKNDDKKYRK